MMWLIAFGLLTDLTGTAGCSSGWYTGYWGWYWSGLWVTPGGLVSSRACSNWRAVLGFSGISWILFLCSAAVVGIVFFRATSRPTLIARQGLYVFADRDSYDDGNRSYSRR